LDCKFALSRGARTRLINAYVAEREGFFEQEGLNVAMSLMRWNVARDDPTIDFQLRDNLEVIPDIARGVGVKMIASEINTLFYELVTLPEIKSVEGLKGKTLAIGSSGDIPDMLIEGIMGTQGFKHPGNYSLIVVGGTNERVAALKAKKIHGTCVSPPSNFMLEDEGFNILVGVDKVRGSLRNMAYSGLYARDEFAKENPEAVKAVIRAFLKANKFIAENRERTVRCMVEAAEVDESIAEKSYDMLMRAGGFSPDGRPSLEAVKANIDWMVSKGQLSANLPQKLYDPNTYVDLRFLPNPTKR